ncbi:MAG TPA: DNA methyltransferase [Melioribacteraceae bacterium]|nr:DNA methyltransferase [Melioribacteraceae bacterium]
MSEPSLSYVSKNILFPNEREKLFDQYKHIIETNYTLNRTLVSFQANKKEPFYRWLKYKEGFSKKLIDYFIEKYHPSKGHILDPFAGSGATLFAAREKGWESTGVELLPIGIFNVEARLSAEKVSLDKFKREVDSFWESFENTTINTSIIKHISITRGAFPEENESSLNRYLACCKSISDSSIRKLLEFAAFSVLEEISFTRKDGQYLRWDSRANRSFGNTEFNKGEIYNFIKIVKEKIDEIFIDLSPHHNLELFSREEAQTELIDPIILQGSSLDVLPRMKSDIFDFVMTSPPYCNRYDYTRTYALELIFLNNNDDDVKKLRQTMLTCTVENKEKLNYLENLYTELNRPSDYNLINSIYYSHPAMTEINDILSKLNGLGKLNNSNIPRMVKNYFYEMLFVIYEMYRLLKYNGVVVMVNDNVRYGGEEIPVDLILSDFAKIIGFKIKKIWTLPTGKGNSSQQMGEHGRSELRKCVYIWEK